MATNKKPINPTNSAPKTYGKRPVPFQFPDSEEKMYIGSEVSRTVSNYMLFTVFSFCLTSGWQLFASISWNTL